MEWAIVILITVAILSAGDDAGDQYTVCIGDCSIECTPPKIDVLSSDAPPLN